MNNKYYFTFGSSGQVYQDGWVEIHADSLREAQDKFIDHFGERAWHYEGVLNYAFSYTQEEYDKDMMSDYSMFRNGNGGVYCHEVIK